MRDYVAYGAVAELFDLPATLEEGDIVEVLLDGPANTGKSVGAGHFLHWLASEFPGCRIAVVRKTMTSLRTSWQVTYETKVLWPGHPILRGGASRFNRTHYDYPNGSTIELHGIDNPTRLYSTEYDVIYVNEAIELTIADWEPFHRALRNHRLPFQMLLGDTNPGGKMHWLNQRCIEGICRRIHSRHEDNPAITEKDLANLRRSLSGVRKERLYYGRWVSAEGAVWPNWDPDVHMISGALIYDEDRMRWTLIVTNGDPALPRSIPIRWFFGSIDWGHEEPGCLQIWAVDFEGRKYRVAEIYRKRMGLAWWAERAHELFLEFRPVAYVCDHAPAVIQMLNEMILGKDDGVPIAIKAKKDRLSKDAEKAGIEQVRMALDPRPDGTRGAYWVRDAICWGPDEELVENKKPWCSEMEMGDYTYRVHEDGKVYREEPDPLCVDHGCDATRYAHLWAWLREYGKEEERPKYPPGTYGGDLLGGKWDDIVAGKVKLSELRKKRREGVVYGTRVRLTG